MVLDVDKLAGPPARGKAWYGHLWADWIELLCLTSSDGEISSSDVIDLLWESEDLGDLDDVDVTGAPVSGAFVPEEELEERNRLDFLLGEEPYDRGIELAEPEPAAVDDARERQVGEWFHHFEYRTTAFGDCYPFAVDPGLLRLKSHAQSDQHCRLYLFLLLSSNLNYVGRSDEGRLAAHFEIVSLAALKAYFPRPWKVWLFGTSRFNKGRYSGNIWDKIRLLATDLGEPVGHGCKSAQEDPRNTGDRGLDVVAYRSFAPAARGQAIAFGQCTCEKGWPDKQLEAHSAKWRPLIQFKVNSIAFTFIPYCYRDAGGGWHDSTIVGDCVLVDRVRIVQLARNRMAVLERLHPYAGLVRDACADRRPVP